MIYQLMLEQKSNIVEGFTWDTVNPLTQEAVQSIASVYDDENLVLPSLTIQGALKVNGKIISNDLDVSNKITSKDTKVNGHLVASVASIDKALYTNNTNVAKRGFHVSGDTNVIKKSDKIKLTNGYGNLTTCTRGVCGGAIAMAGGSNNGDAASINWKISK